jgi:hypothetical protein
VELDAAFAEAHPPARPGRFLQLAVSDGGSGMTPDVLERVFEPFFTTRPQGEGTGMGLAVVHGIVHRHGGIVTAESEPGRGSTFRVYLPVVATPATRADAADTPLPRGTERILVVDDEPAVATAGANAGELGYTVHLHSPDRRPRTLRKPSLRHGSADLAIPELSGEHPRARSSGGPIPASIPGPPSGSPPPEPRRWASPPSS